jgi:hypothetical protein
VELAWLPFPELRAQSPRLLCELRQSFPVEGDAVAGPGGRQRHALVQRERVFDIVIEPKSVRLEIGTVWAGREKVDGDVVGAVWLVTGRLNASASRAIFMKAVTPPQLVTSGSG